jgi:hypothetical protein
MIPDHAPKSRAYLWSPLPIIADVALENCLKAIHKRTDAYHILLIPKLYSSLWLCLLYKLSDFIFKLIPSSPHWLANMHKPIFIGISLGVYTEHQCWWTWKVKCVECKTPTKEMDGIFCANFGNLEEATRHAARL